VSIEEKRGTICLVAAVFVTLDLPLTLGLPAKETVLLALALVP
jgi:hypothetical protein